MFSLVYTGLAKFQAILEQASAEREAAFQANEAAKAKQVAIRAEMEFLGEYAHTQAELIKEAEAAADGALVAFNQYTDYVNKERNDFKAYALNQKNTLLKTKDDLTKELAAAKDTWANATGGIFYMYRVEYSVDTRMMKP